MPKDLPIGRIISNDVTRRTSREHHITGGVENTSLRFRPRTAGFGSRIRMRPLGYSGLIIDCLQSRAESAESVFARSARSRLLLARLHRSIHLFETLDDVNVKQSRSRIKGRRSP